MVRRQNGHARVPWNPRREPVGDALRHAGQFREGDAFNRLLPLNLKRNVVGELPGRFLKPLVEGGHGSEEILQGRTSEANPAPPPRPTERRASMRIPRRGRTQRITNLQARATTKMTPLAFWNFS